MDRDVTVQRDSSDPTATLWHTQSVPEVAKRLGVDPDVGLDSEAVGERLGRYGPNELLTLDRPSSLAIFARQFTSFLTVLLIAAAVASGVVLGEWVDAGAIGAIILLNSGIGFVQEYRAAAALAALRSLSVPTAHVVRSGAPEEVHGAEVVPGDVLLVAAGDRVAADARLTWTRQLEVDESTLTGESLPSTKSTEPVEGGVALGDRSNMVFGGTTIAAGRAGGIVVDTGAASEVGKVAGLTAGREPPTPLQRDLDVVGRRLAVVAIVAALLVMVLGVVRGLALETMVLTGVALAVAVIPEGLPTIVAVTLARGMERMARRNALVRRLSAVEALGGAAVICTDKTGTLTENRLAVRRVAFLGEVLDVQDVAELFRQDDRDDRFDHLLDVMVMCNDAFESDGEYRGDALDVALLRSAAELGDDIVARRAAATRVAEVPFESERKRMDVFVSDGTVTSQLVKGAPEVVLGGCDRVAVPGGFRPFGREEFEEMADAVDAMARAGLRPIALAHRDRTDVPSNLEDAETNLVLIAVVGFADGPRPAVRDSVDEAHRAGIEVVMITGDHRVTAQAIGETVGILDGPARIMEGERLRTIDQAELDGEIDQYRAFSRVDPADKVKIVKAWQHAGMVVAMTGDGVNDGPALRAADIGVAMGSGTDVAKDASGVVLEDDNFATMVDAVREGRKIFTNLRNVVHYLLSANSSEILTMVVGFGLFGALGEPLRAAQLLWINLVSDGLPALALGLEEPSEDVMALRPGAGRDVLSPRNIVRLLGQGTALAAAAVAMIVVGEFVLDRPWPVTQTMVFTALVVSQLLHALNLQPEPLRHLRGRLGAAVLGSLAAHVAIVYLPFTQTAFSIVPLGVVEWAWALAAAAAGFLGARWASSPSL